MADPNLLETYEGEELPTCTVCGEVYAPREIDRGLCAVCADFEADLDFTAP